MTAETAAKPTLLLVDDTPSNIDVLRGILGAEYTLKIATSGERALEIAGQNPQPDLILLDIMMPGLDGYETCRRLKKDLRTARIPVIFVTAMNEIEDEAEGFKAGCVDYLIKPVTPPLVLARVKTHLELYDQKRLLAGLVQKRTSELEQTRLEVIRRLGRAAEYKDDETGTHVVRMSRYAQLLARASGYTEEQAEIVLHAAPMHDVGKIGVPDAILQKRGGLSSEEWAIMRRHPEIGAEILGESAHPLFEAARTVALTHHEKWDGTGYPRRLKGEQIPLLGRIVALCDVFDALTSNRPYKEAWPVASAMGFIRTQKGSHFDPALVELFETLMPELEAIRAEHPEEPPRIPAGADEVAERR